MEFSESWGTHVPGGTGPGHFGFPADLATVINSGIVFFEEYVYVADVKNNQIQVFCGSPKFNLILILRAL